MTETLRRGYPGMKSVKDMPVIQDGPPPGGFPSVRYARRIPSGGPAGATLFAVSALVIGYGFYKVGINNKKRRAIKEEKFQARITLAPVLQAEEDRRYVNNLKDTLKNESELMKNVPGWTPGAQVYNTRWMPPTKPVGAWGEV